MEDKAYLIYRLLRETKQNIQSESELRRTEALRHGAAQKDLDTIIAGGWDLVFFSSQI